MANDGTLDSELFVLIDNWTGPTISNKPPPGGFLSPLEFDTLDPAHLIGSKIKVINDNAIAGDYGFSTFIYLRGLGHTESNPTIAAKQFCTISVESKPYQVSNDPDRVLQNTGCPLVAVALGLMSFTETATRYGWFWCGGVVPEEHIRAFGGNFPTKDGAIAAAGPLACDDLSTDAMGLAVVGADTSAIIGYSYSADS